MADIIQLLPDSIANQIAAGEVIQRPASVVKELIENAIDAGSTSIKLVIKDAGKTLIQVIDNGSGMSGTDARMCFERHATSKIKKAADLFSIHTKGFRGEAMASIAAIAQVEMKTRLEIEDLGSKIVIEGSEVKKQEPCQAPKGTTLSIKNLFFNVPARRKFLKSNPVEMRYIMDEFQRLAISHPDIFFSLHHNNIEMFHLPPGSLRQRIVGVLGANTNKKLVPISEDTDILKLSGFVGKPEFAKKTRGEQLFFVNNRFIKSSYLNHAVMLAYEELLPKDTYPLYVIFMEMNPNRIDINVHPTKQEIKFEDERLVYNYLKVAVRHSLGQHSIMPTLDFEQLPAFNTQNIGIPSGESSFSNKGSDFSKNFKNSNAPKPASLFGGDRERQQSNAVNWQKLYEGLNEFETDTNEGQQSVTIPSKWEDEKEMNTSLESEDASFGISRKPYQIHNTYIVSHIKSGFLLIDQHTAHQRILYEQYVDKFKGQETVSKQQLLFPKTLRFSALDADLLKNMLPAINLLGFDMQEFGKETFVVHAIPTHLKNADELSIIEHLLEQYKSNQDLELDVRDNLARAMARSTAIKRGKEMTTEEMQILTDQLFACRVPYKGPNGKSCFKSYDLERLKKDFE
ncbi:MAG: DNA mismatch repair endonuclease MutL [Saprospiraceae bacterium]